MLRTRAAAALLLLAASTWSIPACAAGPGLEPGRAESAAAKPGRPDGPRRLVQVERDRRGGYDGRWFRRERAGKALSNQEIRRILRAGGFREIRLDRRGKIYQVQATDSGGRRVGLVVSARNGAILTTYRIE